MRDPFYQQIREALGNEDLHPSLFEACAVDLLREVHPGLVPVRGGSDSGFDGAVADGEGEPFPLVCTTEGDVIGNLTKSLDSYVAHGGTRRTAILATSQGLTPQRRQKLLVRAREKGFELLQIHDRQDFAQRLYRNAHWCKELLGLSGTPAALSLVPLSRRPLLDLEPVGRAQDISWLLSTEGDRVVTGEPGSGKTFLLRHLMLQQGWPGLFLCTSNETEIAHALRAQQPEFIVVVDDAHVDPSQLIRLRRLRTEIEAEFSIVATTWHGAADSVVEALGVSGQDVRRLELLTRNQIVEVYRQAGVDEDDGILRSLVDQASNKPGLAATIAHLWLRGGWQEVLDGTALSRNVLDLFRDLVGNDCAPLLAAFSLGGEQGMGFDVVAEFLGIGRADLQSRVVALAAGGVLSEAGRGELRVRPSQLRSALLRKVFFTKPTTLDYQPLLAASQLPSAAETLALAKAYGAEIPDQELRDLVQRSGTPEVWEILVRTNEQNASWALDHYLGDDLDLASAALRVVPQVILPRLLERAEDATGPIHSQPDHPLRIVSDWLRDADTEEHDILAHRSLAVHIAKRYLRGGGRSDIGIHLIFLAFAPVLEATRPDPGSGSTITIYSELLSDHDLQGLENLWPEIRGEIRRMDGTSWPHVATALWEWIDPESLFPGKIAQETTELMRRFGARVLTDLVPLTQENPGLASELRELAEGLGLDLGSSLTEDPIFETLFPRSPSGSAMPMDRLAADWGLLSPDEIAERLHRYEREAQAFDRRWPRQAVSLCQKVALATESPEVWLTAFCARNLAEDLIRPFLEEVLRRGQTGWQTQIRRYLDEPRLGSPTASLVVGLADPPPALLAAAIGLLEARRVELLCLRGEVSIRALRALLLHEKAPVSLAAAYGEWKSEPHMEVRAEISAEWKSAILRANPEAQGSQSAIRHLEHSLREILGSNPELAFEWLHLRLSEATAPFSLGRCLARQGPARAALSVLAKQQRASLLGKLSPQPALSSLLRHLIGRDLDLYEQLLQRPELQRWHLCPLSGFPRGDWIPLGLAAYGAGFEPEEIAGAALKVKPSSASELSFWSCWDRAFASLIDDPRAEIGAIGRAGRRLLVPRLQAAREADEREASEGL